MSDENPYGTPPPNPEPPKPPSDLPQSPPTGPATPPPPGSPPQAPPPQGPPTGPPPGQSFGTPHNAPDVPDHMIWSIITTALSTFCCQLGLPFGIIGIVWASRANSKKQAGDYAGALADAKTAKLMNIIGTALIALGFIGLIGIFAVSFIGASTSP